jgi:uncharacterized membrane protein
MTELKDIFARAEKWPVDAQLQLLRVAEVIEQNQKSDFELTEEDWKIIDERVAHGEIATDAEVEAVFSKYRMA